MHDYNTQRSPIFLKEYGRNIQKLVAYIATLKDKNIRTQYAHTLVRLMETINGTTNRLQKRWRDLFIMSNHTLDIENTHPIPEKNCFTDTTRAKLTYMTGPIQYRCYGRNIENLIQQATTLSSPEEQEQIVVSIARLMKHFSYTWNKEGADFNTILEDIQRIAGDKLLINVERVKAKLASYSKQKPKLKNTKGPKNTFIPKKNKESNEYVPNSWRETAPRDHYAPRVKK